MKVRAAVNTADLSVTWYCSLVPRLFSGEGKRAWYTLFARASNYDLKTRCFNVGVSWMTYGRVVGFGETSQRSRWLAIPAVCGELLYSPSMQWLFLGLLQQSNDGLQEFRPPRRSSAVRRRSASTRLSEVQT